MKIVKPLNHFPYFKKEAEDFLKLCAKAEFDVSKLDAGIYFYTVSNQNQLLKTQKFIISK